MNILHLSAVKNWGGGENHIENLCYELKSISEVRNIVFCVKNGKFHRLLQKTKIPVLTAPMGNKMDPRFFFSLAKACKTEQIDLIHIHDTTALTMAVLADKIKNLPPFVFSKKTTFPIQERKRTLYKYNYPKIKKILCVSQTTLNETSKNISENEKLTVVYHGTRLDNKSQQTPFRLKEKLNLPQNKIIVGNIANHVWYKDLDTFIEVINHVVHTLHNKDFHFVQIGAFTSQTHEIKKKVKELNLEKYVSFLGFMPRASNFIPQFDMSLITSENEGIPQVIYESFYHEIPVVSTKVGGIGEIIEHSNNGFLAKAFDYKTLSEYVLILSQDSALRDKFTQISKKKLLENFTTPIMAQKTLAEYKKIIDGKS